MDSPRRIFRVVTKPHQGVLSTHEFLLRDESEVY